MDGSTAMNSALTAAGITGRTRVYGILADPIYHVKAPEVMGALFARHGGTSRSVTVSFSRLEIDRLASPFETPTPTPTLTPTPTPGQP